MGHDAIVVGGGVAGLTAAAYLARYGYRVLLCEKEAKAGGLVNSFEYKGFTFDGGIRAVENSGIVTPMLRQLGLDVSMVRNAVSIGIGDDIVRLRDQESLQDYRALLERQFPQSAGDIRAIMDLVKRVMKDMDVLYGIDNPLFLDLKKDREYLMRTVLPWMFRYALAMPRLKKLRLPVDEKLRSLTRDQALIDMIAQHFFKKTPAYFALSYFSLYLDYRYPKGGTGALAHALEEYFLKKGGEIRTGTEIRALNARERRVTDAQGATYEYRMLVWAADMHGLYRALDANPAGSGKADRTILQQKRAMEGKTGGDSVFTLYLTLDLPPAYFEKICSAHFFYTPAKAGLAGAAGGPAGPGADRAALAEWVKRYLKLTTYEIAIPALRDESLAPEGQTGLIISTLFDYPVAKRVFDLGFDEEFRDLCEREIIGVLDGSVFPGLKDRVTGRFSSTPLTIEKRTGNFQGAITGWSFQNDPVPAVSSLPKVARSVLTPIPDVVQAGQWTFSPSGLPISILTGKLAADRVRKTLR